jgi:hypothetical protein
MIKPILLSALLAGTFLFTGCGEDSSTEPRINFVTMINATQNTISSVIADLGTKDIASKDSRGEDIEAVSEAPKVSYDGGHNKTISIDDGFSGYIATSCNADGFLYHTGALGDLRIVNTSSKDITAKVAGKDIDVPSCSVVKTDTTVSEDSIIVVINGETKTIDPDGETVWDSVVFEDDTFKNFIVKSLKL